MRLRSLLVMFALLGALIGTDASAQLLFAGGEDVDFLCNGGGGCTSSTGATYRSGWARTSYMAAGTTADPAINRFATSAFTASSTVWIHAQFCLTSAVNTACGNVGAGSTATEQMIRVLDSSGNPTLIVRATGVGQQVKISSRTAAGVFTDLVTCSLAYNVALTQLDFYINYGTSGEVTLYSNSVQVCDYTGNVTNGDGATTVNQVEFARPVLNPFSAWSEVIVAGSDTRAMSRFTANTVANGATTGFSGTNVCSAIWSATSFNDASFGYSGSTNVVHECTINSSIPAGNFSVLGLVMTA